MEKYVKPEVSVVKFEKTDIIVTSGLINKGEIDFTNPDTDLEWNSINLNN